MTTICRKSKQPSDNRPSQFRLIGKQQLDPTRPQPHPEPGQGNVQLR